MFMSAVRLSTLFRCGLATLLFLTGALVAQAEIIRDFTAQYEIRPDGTVQVVETITYDFEESERRGIIRDLSQ